MSASHRNRGDGFERVIADMHAIYERQGRASCIRTPPSMKVLRPAGKPGQFVACYEGEGPPDWFVQAGGVSIVADVKDCAADRWPLDHLPKHQADRFDKHEAHGGVAGIILRMRGVVWWLPWRSDLDGFGFLRSVWFTHHDTVGRAAPGTASLSVADCDRMGRRACGADWLSAALT